MKIRTLKRLIGKMRHHRSELRRRKIQNIPVENKYLAFIDVLGFSRATLDDFQSTTEAYVRAFAHIVDIGDDYPAASIKCYSDAVMVTADNLKSVVLNAQLVSWAMLLQNYLVRGGLAFGKHKEVQVNGSLCVISEALTRAVQLEKHIHVPCIGIDSSVVIPKEWWIPYPNPFGRPVLHYSGMNIISPFLLIWGKSARLRVSLLKEKHPEHSEKYDWFLGLYDACYNNQLLVPDNVKEGWTRVMS